jgi:3-oxoacyl-[acyl-carrier protein] reductase
MTELTLDRRIILITGASRGLGRGYAFHLAARGALVALNARDPERLAQVAEEIGKTGGRAVALAGDVSSPGVAEQVWQRAERELGMPHALINNAGVNRDRTVVKMSDEEWREVLAANLDATFYACRAAVRAWCAAGCGGRIVNTTSLAGSYGNFGQANYAAAKAGVIGFSMSLAREVASHRITVNVISPVAATDMTDSMPARRREAFYARQARTNTLGRPGEPADVAPVVAFLCSEESAYLTGQTIVASGTPGR